MPFNIQVSELDTFFTPKMKRLRGGEACLGHQIKE
nr:MAG TPA: hypothetical protein [Caudoviricetes sp.]